MHVKLSEWSTSERMLDIPAFCRSVFECIRHSVPINDAFNRKGNVTTGVYREGGVIILVCYRSVFDLNSIITDFEYNGSTYFSCDVWW